MIFCLLFFISSLRFSFSSYLPPSLIAPSHGAKMSRHNRRRHRAGHRPSHADFQLNSFELSPLSNNAPNINIANPRFSNRNEISARHWRNRYLAWTARERKQVEEREKLKEERKRIFGGDSQDGDDADGLCGRMMEFFVAMDYLEV